MSKIFTANRVAAIATWLSGLSALLVGVTGTFPHAWQNTAAMAAGLLVKAVTALHFMTGSQKYDALTTPYPVAAPAIENALAITKAAAALPDPPPVAPEVAPPAPAVS